jgi:tetraacyldisaccharide 4'-kinase
VLWLINRWQTVNIVSMVLWPLSIVYCAIIMARRMAYRAGILKSYYIGLPVIIVGNLTVGGTGKTPFVIWLVGWLQTRGHRPGIVLRGYGGNSPAWPRQVTADTPTDEVGDEAVLLARRTACPVVAGPDRVAAANMLGAGGDCTIIVSDDGLQHYRLRRDYEIMVVDGERQFGNGFCLPAGPLREPAARARSADLVIINGQSEDTPLSMRVNPTVIRNLKNRQSYPTDQFSGKTLHAVAGIGNPGRFFDTLGELGIKIVEHPFPDHYRFSASDLEFGEDHEVIMTEKDAVKCTGFAGSDCWVLEVEASPSRAVIEKIQTRLQETRVG